GSRLAGDGLQSSPRITRPRLTDSTGRQLSFFLPLAARSLPLIPRNVFFAAPGGHTRPVSIPGTPDSMLRALILLALSCLLSPAFAVERAQTQQQLDATRQDIAELKKMLGKLQAEKSGVQKDLKATETDTGNLEKQVEALQQELKKTEGELERLDTEKKKLQSARVEQQRLIAIQARSAYQNGREEYLKLLLNQQNPDKFARTLTY